MLRATDNPRDRALVAVAAATGARRGEILGLKICDITPRPYGYDVVFTGKTGTHPGPPIVKDYAKILRIWLEHHPFRDNPESPLWVRLIGGQVRPKYEPIHRVAAHGIIKKIAKSAGLKRNVHFHMFRHTENTWETKHHVSAAARKKLHGWSPMSTTPSIYEHLTDGDSVDAVLQSHGIINHEEEKSMFEPVKCGYCGYENVSIAKYCLNCGVPLTEEDANKIVAERNALDFITKMLENPETKKAFIKILDEAIKLGKTEETK